MFAGVPFVSLFLCVSSIFLTSFVAAMSLLNNLGSIWAHCLGVKPMRPEAQGSSYKSLFHPVDSVFFMLEHVCSVWAAWSLAEIRGVRGIWNWPPCGCWESDLGPREEQKWSFTAETFPQPLSVLYALLPVALHCRPCANYGSSSWGLERWLTIIVKSPVCIK